MDSHKQERLQAAGWRVGDAREFLDLSDEDAAQVERKLAMGERRRKRG